MTHELPAANGDFGFVHYLENNKVFLKQIFNPNYFSLKHTDPKIIQYLSLNRSQTTFNPNVNIPVADGYIKYQGKEMGGVNDRPVKRYQERLFPDIFRDETDEERRNLHQHFNGWSVPLMLSYASTRENSEPQFGGYDNAFAPGKTVLDIGSGQALGLIQLALEFPQTCFIGMDILYCQKLRVYPGKTGLQLTQDSWFDFSQIPDNSIDTILSIQGLGMWGLPVSQQYGSKPIVTADQGEQTISHLNRITKPGAIVRIDQGVSFLEENLTDSEWDKVHIPSSPWLFIAQKKF